MSMYFVLARAREYVLLAPVVAVTLALPCTSPICAPNFSMG